MLMQGEADPLNSLDAYTQTLVPFVATAYTDDSISATVSAVPDRSQLSLGNLDLRRANRATLSSLLKDEIILEPDLAATLGYDMASKSWQGISHISLSFLMFGSDGLLPVVGKAPVEHILVQDLSAQEYQAMVGMSWWQRYVAGIDYHSDGHVAVLFLSDFEAVADTVDTATDRHFISLPGLNSIADDMYGAVSANGVIAFESNRPGGAGDMDIYVWSINEGLLELPGLNSAAADSKPALSSDGNLLAFESRRNGLEDVFVYDLNTRTFVDLPGLNTVNTEADPTLSADGTLLAYTTLDVNDRADIHFYYLADGKAGENIFRRLNTRGHELQPTLNADASLLAFTGMQRNDSTGRNPDIYLYNLQRNRLLDLPRLNSLFLEAAPTLSPDGTFLAFHSSRSKPEMAHLGNDIMLLEISSGELLAMPGINSEFEDAAPALTPNAEYLVFHSKRPGGMGGYDLYLYQRDLDDKTRYTVSQPYTETGYVMDDNGVPQAGVSVQMADADGNSITVLTDSVGNFTVDIPAGMVLPLTYSAERGNAVTDDVGDDTYIPYFEAGNLKFTQVWVEDTMQAGMPTKIWFDVETETPKYNTFVKLYLVELATGTIDELEVSAGDFEAAYTLTALTIEQLGQVGPGDTVTKTQGQDIKTEISYLSEDNRKAHLEQSFIVPAEVENGTYAVVFSIGRFDYHPEDDALQSEDEADRHDNYMVAPASVIIGQPDKPNLRILSAKLNSNSFELPSKRPTEESTPFSSELALNMEVESMAQDTKLPVDITFALDIDGQSYPLSFADNKGSRPSKAGVKTYPVTCREETREGYPEGERCASLFRQEQTGYTYKLYLNGEAYDALAAKTADTLVDLVIRLDPETTVDEWENNTADNVKMMPVMYLTPRATRQTRNLTNTPNDYGTDFFTPVAEAEDYGNDDFGVGYAFNAALTYAEGSYNSTAYPYAAAFDGEGNRVYINIFGNEIDVLLIDVGADFNGDKIICSWFEYNVDILEQDQYDAYLYVDGIDPSAASCDPSGDGTDTEEATQEVELWSTQDDDGNELYTVSKSKDYEKTFTVGGIPITVAAGATGDLGIRGDVTIDTSNTLDIEVGPYLELTGYAEGGVGVGW